jgi:hypothetical protein
MSIEPPGSVQGRACIHRLLRFLRMPVSIGVVCLALATLAPRAWAPTWWVAESPPTEVWVTCTPIEVLAFNSRVHVRCAESFNFGGSQSAIVFFAVPTNDDGTGVANRFTTITSAALSGDNRVRVLASYYDNGTSWGCQISSCKPARAVAIVP